MSDIIKKAYLAGLGAVSITREKLENFTEDLVKRGEVSREEKAGLLSDLVKAAEKRKDELEKFIQKEVQKVLKTLKIPTREEVDALQEKVEQLLKRQENE